MLFNPQTNADQSALYCCTLFATFCMKLCQDVGVSYLAVCSFATLFSCMFDDSFCAEYEIKTYVEHLL